LTGRYPGKSRAQRGFFFLYHVDMVFFRCPGRVPQGAAGRPARDSRRLSGFGHTIKKIICFFGDYRKIIHTFALTH
jgi:hypothetical protein